MWAAASFGDKAARPRTSFTCSQILSEAPGGAELSGLGNGEHPHKLAVRSLGYRTVVGEVNCVLVGGANNLVFEVGLEDLDKEAKGDNVVMSRLISQGHSASNASGEPCVCVCVRACVRACVCKDARLSTARVSLEPPSISIALQRRGRVPRLLPGAGASLLSPCQARLPLVRAEPALASPLGSKPVAFPYVLLLARMVRCACTDKKPSGGELWGLASHPSKPIFGTAGDDGILRLW